MQKNNQPAERKTVLVLDDDEFIRTVVRDILVKAGYPVLEAHGCSDAVLIFEQHKHRIGLVLTDIVMPKMSGRDLVNILMASTPDLKVVYMSGYIDMAPLQGGKEALFIHKPFSPQDLVAIVEKALAE